MKCLPLEQFITMMPNTEVISISSFNLIFTFQVITWIAKPNVYAADLSFT